MLYMGELQMKLRERSLNLLRVTRSKAKMYEYSVPLEDHIAIPRNPAHLFPISVSLLGDVAAYICNPGQNQEVFQENILELRKSALFFDSYIQTRLTTDLDEYLSLLAASAYYLCDLPGSSSALIKRFSVDQIRRSNGLSRFLLWILESNYEQEYEFRPSVGASEYTQLKEAVGAYFIGEGATEPILNLVGRIRAIVYSQGTPRELLLTDVCLAVLTFKLRNSTKTLLPQYSGLPLTSWSPVLRRNNFIHELWPSQRLLGQEGIFQGVSAVVQMPTSAGKSKSIEVIIRSAFLGGRTRTCVVIAPFRALCREISETLESAFAGENVRVNELSDVYQNDFDADELIQNTSYQILSVTPEKLVYVLRQSPELANEIGLLILDEGHQFDNDIRGVTFELLVTTMKSLLPANVQTVLISAVISNADAIKAWLLGESGRVVRDTSIAPTYRTVGFTSWHSARTQGKLQYVNSSDISVDDFWVPRVIEQQTLARRPRERTDRVFPVKEDGKTVAAHLGIKLVSNGGVAIFCGLKSTVASLTAEIVEAFSRGYVAQAPLIHSDEGELMRIAYLFQRNFGEDSIECQGARLGILSHHAGIPHGLRLAIEHSLRTGKAKFIVCTSTLAQGVNLPIRYLIFTNIYQAGERISVRDFQNLIGRAGRSGLQTEGTILFADPEVYDKKNHRREGWRFRSVTELFDSTRSEPCTSSLLSIFDPIQNVEQSRHYGGNEIIRILESFYQDESSLNTLVTDGRQYGFEEKNLRAQLKYKIKIASAVEGQLMASLSSVESETRIIVSAELARKTYAYHLASLEQKELLERLFILICKNIDSKVESDSKKTSYSRTLLGLAEMIEIDAWINGNTQAIVLAEDNNAIFIVLYPIIEKFIGGANLKKIFPEGQRVRIAEMWINGIPYNEILDGILENGSYQQAGTQRRRLSVSHIVEVCDGELAFDGMLVLGAIAELLESHALFGDTTFPDSIRKLQKRIKYGLSTDLAVRIFELGFSDRIIASDIADYLSDENIATNIMLKEKLVEHSEEVQGIVDRFPSYFSDVLNKYLDT
jgi:POLQ-like helicase